MLIIESKKKKIEKINEDYPSAYILDVTSKSDDKWVQLSPFYPHGGIPVPFSSGWFAESVEGIWQGLKVFEKHGTDVRVMREMSMTHIKRSEKTLGKCIGHQKGMESNELLGYIDARKQIYLLAYFWVLENRCQKLLEEILEMSRKGIVVLLDYNTNDDIEDASSPLSHASLIIRYLSQYITEQERIEWSSHGANIIKKRKEHKWLLKKENHDQI